MSRFKYKLARTAIRVMDTPLRVRMELEDRLLARFIARVLREAGYEPCRGSKKPGFRITDYPYVKVMRIGGSTQQFLREYLAAIQAKLAPFGEDEAKAELYINTSEIAIKVSVAPHVLKTLLRRRST